MLNNFFFLFIDIENSIHLLPLWMPLSPSKIENLERKEEEEEEKKKAKKTR